MNCYYSNLIEGHNTHPVDIERALNGDYSQNIEKRNLQLEAFAHIEVQRLIDNNLLEDTHLGTVAEGASIISFDYLSLIHRHFYERLPKELQWVEDPKTKKKLKVNPGKFRQRDVQVGNHIACSADKLPLFISRFEEAYDLDRLSKLQQLIAVGASHHRLLWIHPFLDGNGRVARLFSHAFLRTLGIGNSLWSVSRGLARRATDYKRLLKEALITGSFERGQAAELTGYKERQARTVLSTLLNKGLLYSEHSRAKVRIAFPVSILDKWLPGLY